MTAEVKIVPSDLHEDRYSRLRLIPWWDETKIRAARVLVVGAGALGNEILKNLALLGFQQVVVVDLDRIEESNLSRAVLFRDSDVGKSKADAAAFAYESLCPGATVQPIAANIIYQVGLGLFAWSDLIIAGLDNREARLWINRAAWKVNRPWIDGAIEGINGVVRLFAPASRRATNAPLAKPIGRSLSVACLAIFCWPKPTFKERSRRRRPSRPSSQAYRSRRR